MSKHRFPKPQRRSEPREPTSSQKQYFVTINQDGSEGTSPFGLEEEPPIRGCAEAFLSSIPKKL